MAISLVKCYVTLPIMTQLHMVWLIMNALSLLFIVFVQICIHTRNQSDAVVPCQALLKTACQEYLIYRDDNPEANSVVLVWKILRLPSIGCFQLISNSKLESLFDIVIETSTYWQCAYQVAKSRASRSIRTCSLYYAEHRKRTTFRACQVYSFKWSKH